MFHPDSAYRHSVALNSEYFFSSNAITNHFASAYLLGKFIDDNMKDDVSNKLSSLNRFGAGFKTELQYTSSNDTVFSIPKSFFSVTLGENFHINSRFGKDVFELYFRGNKDYAGKTADLGKFVYNQLVWQNANFTFGHDFRRDLNHFGYSAGISLIKGQKLYHISSSHASLFTEEYGSYLDLNAEITIRQSDSAKSKFISWNGTGTSANGSFYWQDKNQNTLSITANNIGFIQWNKNSSFVKADTSFRFDGVDVSNLFDLSDSVTQNVSLDSSLVEPYLSSRVKKSFLSPLPALVNVSYQYILSPGKSDLVADVRYLFYAESTLEESITFNYTLKSTHRFSVKARYGGYSGFQVGLGYKSWLFNRILLTIQSDYISSLLNTKNGTGQGAFVSLSTYF